MKMKLILKGRVQGVGMRYFVHFTAKRFAVTGFVRNLYSGDVECLCQGTKSQLDTFIQTIMSEHPGRIDDVIQEVVDTNDTYETFQIELR